MTEIIPTLVSNCYPEFLDCRQSTNQKSPIPSAGYWAGSGSTKVGLGSRALVGQRDRQHDAGLVHRLPQPMFHTGDLECDLIQVPFVATPRQATTDLVGEWLAEF